MLVLSLLHEIQYEIHNSHYVRKNIKIKLTKQNCFKVLCILYFGGFILTRHQMATQQLTPLPNRTGGGNKMEELYVNIKTGKSHTTYCHGQNGLKEKINLIYCQSK